MNKAITDGVLFMPPAFEDGLDVWSSGDGTPGADTYDGAANANLVSADPDLGACLELQKTDTVQKLRYMGQTPVLPGCYLRVRARLKAIGGNLPAVRIAAWVGGAGQSEVTGVPTTGPEVPLEAHGAVTEISAIVGVGARGGVDLPWGLAAEYAHVGLDLTGANGGAVRISDLEIEDVTTVFLRDLINLVDVRDYGALGDGATDDAPSFAAADAAADGRTILVPEGTYRLGASVDLNHPVAFEGTVEMDADKMLLLTKSFDLPTYIDAFGDEELAFRKAFQALLNNADHDALDLGGRKISVTGPIDMQSAVPNKTSYDTRRVIRNGQFVALDGPAWDDQQVTSEASYSTATPQNLSDVNNVAAVPLGALVEGPGVGREVYVTAKNVAAETLTLSAPLHGAVGTQDYTFTRFQYLFDFGGFAKLSNLTLSQVELHLSGRGSGVLLAPAGDTFALRDSYIISPKNRGISSQGTGCAGLLVDRCQFLSDGSDLEVSDRHAIALNAQADDVKLRDNHALGFKHFAVLKGAQAVVLGNHISQGDDVTGGVRSAGLVLTQPQAASVLSGNYIDDCFVEWTNEHEATPDYTAGESFGALSITSNLFIASNSAAWFSFIVIKPFGTGHSVQGLNVTGNTFRSRDAMIERVERVDSSFADLNYGNLSDIHFTGNAFSAVSTPVSNPLRVTHSQATAAPIWTVDSANRLPFQAWALGVTGVTTLGPVISQSGQPVYGTPSVETRIGDGQDQVQLVWAENVVGNVDVLIQIDG
ncbi:MAG: glycosyl hydrolase family 28-related protein [Pseudomonadota bacterium]